MSERGSDGEQDENPPEPQFGPLGRDQRLAGRERA